MGKRSKLAAKKMAEAGAEAIKTDRRKAFWKQKVTCIICGEEVKRSKTVLLDDGPMKGPACKRHEGMRSWR